ncbi:MAG: hypothetical protein KKB30_15610 [Proteobacteria bacterium]|nr:hypothetical protein [Pseudomonadota bacterium]MBU1714449.1 hypothetical protein [Pseudomonadota bacterium]
MNTLLKPFFWSAKHRFFPAGNIPLKTAGIALFSSTVCLVLYFVSLKALNYFHSQNELGIILALKIFQMAWIVMFAMLIFSCMVSAVSTIFLSQDNEIICAAPIQPFKIFQMRYITTSIYTSWMMVIFSIPIFAAYGQVFKAGLPYWPLMLLAIIATAATATAFATTATIVLVNLFPARRTKDILLYLSLCFGIFIYVMFRLMRPEDLVNPDKYGHFVDYLSSISTPAAPYLPAAWTSNFLSLYLLERQIDWLLLALILITPFALFFIGEWVMQRWFFAGYSKSQESFGGFHRFGSLSRYRPKAWQWIFAKELKTFLRDSAEWSQIFMIGALIIVYLYNFKILPVERSLFEKEYITNLISFLNIGLTGFMVASLSARFAYPAIGTEGNAFFIIRSSPLPLYKFLMHKYLFYVIPFTILAIILVAASDHLLQINGPMWWFSVGSIILITWTVVALAIGFGAIYADFKAENRAAALGGIGAIIFLFSAISYEMIVILSGVYPAYRIVGKWLRKMPITMIDWSILAAWGLLATALGFYLSLFFFRKGIKKLQNYS